MANKSKFQAIKGTRDLLPPETALWNQVEQTAREVFSSFHFGEIRPPIFEPTELFARAVGGDTDIVGKEMYVLTRSSLERVRRVEDGLQEPILQRPLPVRLQRSVGRFEDGESKDTRLEVVDVKTLTGLKRPEMHCDLNSRSARMLNLLWAKSPCAPKPPPPSAAPTSSTRCSNSRNP